MAHVKEDEAKNEHREALARRCIGGAPGMLSLVSISLSDGAGVSSTFRSAHGRVEAAAFLLMAYAKNFGRNLSAFARDLRP